MQTFGYNHDNMIQEKGKPHRRFFVVGLAYGTDPETKDTEVLWVKESPDNEVFYINNIEKYEPAHTKV